MPSQKNSHKFDHKNIHLTRISSYVKPLTNCSLSCNGTRHSKSSATSASGIQCIVIDWGISSKLSTNSTLITARVRSTREGNALTPVCVSIHTCGGRGYPISGSQVWGGTLSQVWLGGTPSQVWMGVTPSQVWIGQIPPPPTWDGVPPPRHGMGYPPQTWDGVPPPDMGQGPRRLWIGYPPRDRSA